MVASLTDTCVGRRINLGIVVTSRCWWSVRARVAVMFLRAIAVLGINSAVSYVVAITVFDNT